ncbi:plasmid stability protein [Devosia subaequoris]|uniref:Plasmid stability protein n=1 Tax=Devosia subaequoris TaxID=395930 RepID=A0A7W6IQP5_9HYPH|nr:DUF6364 family protein [Devosia subaequoris]MBB4054080.1 plasmid stability protein [Devosia subaequoris]MCP1211603.1 DUF6364 family protein [Devosia subaequoris]
MLKNTTFNLPEELVAKAKAYAADHGTTMTAIVRSHLEAVIGADGPEAVYGPLLAFSKGEISSEDALRELDLRDYSELLVALGDADLPMPMPAPHEVENQAALFERLWKHS